MLVLYALASTLEASLPLWQPSGTLGLSTDYGATVRSVLPDGPAERAGVRAGDRIELARVPTSQRRYLAGAAATIAPGTVVHVPLEHEGVVREITLTAAPVVFGPADRVAILAECLTAIVFIGVGAALIALRPSAATWGFGLYCLLLLPTGALPTVLPGTAASIGATLLYDVVQNLGVVGIVIFALHFPAPFAVGWRERLRRALPIVYVILVAMTLYPDVANLLLGIGAQLENRVLQVAFGLMYALAIAILFDSYRRVLSDQRERMQWVLVGFGLGLVTNYIGNTLIFSTLVPTTPPAWFETLLVSLNVLVPITVAYAVVRHRVLDIEFVVGRAIVFTVLTTALTAAFGLLDWVCGNVLEDLRLTHLLQAVLSIAIGFTIGRLERRIAIAVEATFFRKRRLAEAHLGRIILALPRTESTAAVAAAVLSEATTHLDLTSAALFRRRNDIFVREASTGWEDGTCTEVDPGDALPVALQWAEGFVDIDTVAWTHAGLPGGGRRPIIAIPMRSQAELVGFVLYGPHPSGSTIDPAERSLLERIVDAAGLALDNIDAHHVRAENAELRALLARVRLLGP